MEYTCKHLCSYLIQHFGQSDARMIVACKYINKIAAFLKQTMTPQEYPNTLRNLYAQTLILILKFFVNKKLFLNNLNLNLL